jgi:isopentenyldiphosphate isomerase
MSETVSTVLFIANGRDRAIPTKRNHSPQLWTNSVIAHPLGKKFFLEVADSVVGDHLQGEDSPGTAEQHHEEAEDEIKDFH